MSTVNFQPKPFASLASMALLGGVEERRVGTDMGVGIRTDPVLPPPIGAVFDVVLVFRVVVGESTGTGIEMIGTAVTGQITPQET